MSSILPFSPEALFLVQQYTLTFAPEQTSIASGGALHPFTRGAFLAW